CGVTHVRVSHRQLIIRNTPLHKQGGVFLCVKKGLGDHSDEISTEKMSERRILDLSKERICPQIHLLAILNMVLPHLKQYFFPYFLPALPFSHLCIAYSR